MVDVNRLVKGVRVEAPGRTSPAVVRFTQRFVGPLVRLYHRPTLAGVEHLPSDRPYLLVANHSGALATAEIFTFAWLYLHRVGPERPLAGFVHPVTYVLWPTGTFLRALGAIPSTYEHGRDALARGASVLVFPGGDHEAFRPVWQHDRVDFHGRVGFLRLAREAGVPVVPMGIRGSHLTAPVLWRSDWLLARLAVWPWLLGMKRLPLTLLGVLGAAALLVLPDWSLPVRALAAWAWTFSIPACFAWLPATIHFRIGPALKPTELFQGEAGEAQLAAALTRVEGAVRALSRAP